VVLALRRRPKAIPDRAVKIIVPFLREAPRHQFRASWGEWLSRNGDGRHQSKNRTGAAGKYRRRGKPSTAEPDG